MKSLISIFFILLGAAAHAVSINGAMDYNEQFNAPSAQETYNDYPLIKNFTSVKVHVQSEKLRQARITAIDTAVLQAYAHLYGKSTEISDSKTLLRNLEDHVERVLIVDEHFDKSDQTYFGLFDVWFTNEANLHLKYAQIGNANDKIPSWLLIIPTIIDEQNFISLASEKDAWFKYWQKSFVVGNTNIVSTPLNDSDRLFFENIETLDQFTEYLRANYKAEAIAYVSNSVNGLTVLYKNFFEEIYREDQHRINQIASARELFAKSVLSFHSTDKSASQTSEISARWKYRFLGEGDTTEDGAIIVNIQMLHDKHHNDIYLHISENRGFSILEMKSIDNTLLMKIKLDQASTLQDAKALLQTIGLETD